MERRLFLKLGTGAAVGSTLAACGGGSSGTAPNHPTVPPAPERVKVVVSWNMLALATFRTLRTSPTVASRALAIMHTAMYDAWAAYDSVALGTRFGATLRQSATLHTIENRTMAFSYAAYVALLDLFPAQKADFDAQMALLQYNVADAVGGDASPAGVGTRAALAVLAFRRDDGANQLGSLCSCGLPYVDYSSYKARNAPINVALPTPQSAMAVPRYWQPLIHPDATGVLRAQTYMTPYWGKVKAFALSSGDQFRPAAPPVFGTAEYAEQVRDVIQAQSSLTDGHKAMVEFWAGLTTGDLPSGLWSQFAQVVSQREGYNEDSDVKLFFALSNANFDAGIAAWDAKRTFDTTRPISAIRYLFNGQTIPGFGPAGFAGGIVQIKAESWIPYQPATAPTPAHPEYVSGHSAYSAASAEILRLFSGNERFEHSVTIQARTMKLNPALPAADVTLRWNTYMDAATEAGRSRVYAGVHFEASNLAGRVLGLKVGHAVYERAQRYWLGKA